MIVEKSTGSGIYRIINLINEKFYVGSAKNFYVRSNLHKSQLKRNIHFNKHLQSSWNKYGEENFKFEIIKECSKEELITNEQHFIDVLKPQYNKCKVAGSRLGTIHSVESRRKISENRKVEKLTDEWKKNIAEAHRGNVLSMETRQKISKSHTGKLKSTETRLRMSNSKKGLPSPNRGKIASEDTRKKQSESRKRFLENKKLSLI